MCNFCNVSNVVTADTARIHVAWTMQVLHACVTTVKMAVQVVEDIANMLLDDVLQQSAAGW